MRISTPGKVTDNLWLLGNEEACIYLLEGANESMLINGGLSYVVPDILQQLEEFRIDETKIKRMLLLHSHFDHIGAAPFLKKRYPGMILHASARSLQILKKPKAIAAINDASHYAAGSQGKEEIVTTYDVDWSEDIGGGETVSDGSRIDLGGITVEIIETPGHSPCSISAYVPELKALFPSDAGGVPNENGIVPYGTSNYTMFEESLVKLSSLSVDLLCSDHCGIVNGADAGHYINDALTEARRRRELMVATYERTKDLKAAAVELAERFKAENLVNMVSDAVFCESHRQMIMHVTGLKK